MAEKIVEHSALSMYEQDQVKYSIVANRRRALPEIRDGLKPVQRRSIVGAFMKKFTNPKVKAKSSDIVGYIMGNYHPHGDCLRGDTKILVLDCGVVTIKELYESGVESAFVYCLDKNMHLRTVLAHDFRIGQYTNEVYHIKLSNGYEICCTGNHPHMLPDSTFVKTEDLPRYKYSRLFNCSFNDKSDYNKNLKFKEFDKIIDKGLPLGYYVYQTHSEDYTTPRFEIEELISEYDLLHPYIKKIYIEKVDNEPMYDFTVDEYHNMLIPAGSFEENCHCPMICTHNSSIYDAIVCLVDWFKTKMPLFDGKGNWGNVSGSGAAAMRYTECSLSEFGYETTISELSEASNIVDWIPTYKRNGEKEPEFLPVKVPILLINGSFGIGVGISINIPSHNLVEVLDVTRKLLKDPNAPFILVPDLCQPCTIIDTDWKEINEVGNGSFKARGNIEIETDKKGNHTLHITSLPEMVDSTSVYEKILTMIEDKQLPMIKDIHNNIKDRRPDIIICLKQGADPNYVKEVIYAKTDVQKSVTVNFEAVDANGIDIKRFSYRDYLLAFIDQRMNIKFRLYCNKLQQALTRFHQVDAYVKVLESGQIDTLYHMIRKCKKEDIGVIIDFCIKKINLTDIQAKFIIERNISQLSEASLNKYKAERNNLDKIIKQYKAAVTDDGTIIKNEIDAELVEISKKYGTPRICKVVNIDDENQIPGGVFKIVITEKNYIRKIPDLDKIGVIRGDNPKFILRVNNRENLLIFDNKGKVFNLPINKIPITDRSSAGTDIRIVIKNLTSDIISILYLPTLVQLSQMATKGISKHYLTVLTKSNTIKKLDIEDFLNVNPSGLIYSKIKDDDEIVGICLAQNHRDIAICSGHKALRIPMKDIPLFKRNAAGSKAMNTTEPLNGLSVIYPDASDIVVVTKNGKFNRFSITMMSPKARAKSGSSVIKLDKNDEIFNIFAVNENDKIRVVTSEGVEEVPVSDIKVKSSIAAGDKYLLSKGIIIKADVIAKQ